MANPVLKFPPDQEGERPITPPPGDAMPKRSLLAGLKKYRRTLLLVVLPLLAVIGGVIFYLSGGRYVSTDDAYVGAQKVLITPDISGMVDKVVVREGQHVNDGDVLFQIDPAPFRFALQQAQANLDTARTNYENLVSNVKIYGQMFDLGQQGVELKQKDVERKQSLVKSNAGSQLDLDNTVASLVTARTQLEFIRQQISNAKNQLLGKPDLPIEQFPPFAQAKAALDQAQRNLDHTVLKAPMAGTATQVDNIQLGRFIAAGTPILTVIDDAKPWVDANPKESDFTYVTVGQPVTIDVDAFPDHVFKGTIGSLSPGTGAQFSILPAQNASGNFVKVVQRVPVRIYFDPNDKFLTKLKAGMSSTVSIDTGHTRSMASMLGMTTAVAGQAKP